MNYQALALSFDAEEQPVEAAWAYEIAIREDESDLDFFLNLVALYMVSSDFGYSAAHSLPSGFIETSYERALDVLKKAEDRFGVQTEIEFWRLYLQERVFYADIPDVEYERLVQQGDSLMPCYRLYVSSGGTRYRAQVEQLYVMTMDEKTERSRYIKSVLQSSMLPPL